VTRLALSAMLGLWSTTVPLSAQSEAGREAGTSVELAIQAAPAEAPQASVSDAGPLLVGAPPGLFFFPSQPSGLATIPAPDAGPEAAPPAPLGPVAERRQEVWTDPWGQRRNFGLAVFTAYMGNFIPWMYNEVNKGRAELLISQISPRSWWRNIEEGWKWDDNAFQVNFFAHPFQGNIYYTSARANGYGYWTGLAFALAGSFNWECCGETHLMSINDWAMTSLGGAAVGETLFRASSLILDNEATGSERIVREVGAFLLTPTRGFTRLVSGNTTRVYANPENPSDHIPNRLEAFVAGGIRGGDSWRRGRGGQLDEDIPTHGFMAIEFSAGDLANLERQQPFDFVTAKLQFNFVKAHGLGRFAIRGNLWHTDLSRSDEAVTKFVVVQDFDYENNTVFEAGGQSVGLMVFRQSHPFGDVTMALHGTGTWTILGGVKSELAFLADVEGIRERFREYDFGIGPGFRAGVTLGQNGRRLLDVDYRIHYLETLNGASYEGQGSNHLIQAGRVRAILPFLYRGFGAGAEYEFFHRRSEFDIADIGTVKQRAHILDAFVTWYPVRN